LHRHLITIYRNVNLIISPYNKEVNKKLRQIEKTL